MDNRNSIDQYIFLSADAFVDTNCKPIHLDIPTDQHLLLEKYYKKPKKTAAVGAEQTYVLRVVNRRRWELVDRAETNTYDGEGGGTEPKLTRLGMWGG